jgi:hypothetical protein
MCFTRSVTCPQSMRHENRRKKASETDRLTRGRLLGIQQKRSFFKRHKTWNFDLKIPSRATEHAGDMVHHLNPSYHTSYRSSCFP